MTSTLLVTKLFIPPTRPELVPRPRLIERLDGGLHCKLTLISTPAGFGKTTLLTQWLHKLGVDANPTDQTEYRIAWFSIDVGDNDFSRFLTYLITALNRVEGDSRNIGERALGLLQSPQSLPAEVVLTPLINDLAAVPEKILLFLDDYHLIDTQPIHDALIFLLENLPPQIHLVIATREDPPFPLSRLRARGQLIELRAGDLRFTLSEAAEFLNQVMGLDISEEDVQALEARTEGWIAGLQLAAISMQGKKDTPSFIKSFTGSHRLVLDYLIEEVLDQQSEQVQSFLLKTSILERLTADLCDAVTGQDNSQQILEQLEQANLFIIPLDVERNWYRYHHLFADLLRQILNRKISSSTGDNGIDIDDLHLRASAWFEENGLEIEAFQHAAAANDVDRAARLMEGDEVPLQFRGALTPVLNWLESLPTIALEARPLLWVMYAMTLLAIGQTTTIEEKLQAAEAALQEKELDDEARDLIGRIAATRANLAVGQRQVETIIDQSYRALEYLDPDNLTYRTTMTWNLGVAFEFQGDRKAAMQAFNEAISISRETGDIYTQILASTGLGNIQLSENQLHLAADTYQHVLELVGDLPIPVGPHVHLCLARINYQWDDLDATLLHIQDSLQQAEPFKNQNDIQIAGEVFLARLKLALGDVSGATITLARADQSARQHNYKQQLSEVAAAQVLALLHQGNLSDAFNLAEKHQLPVSKARVHLALGEPSAALTDLEPLRRQAEVKGWQDERLKVMVLQSIAMDAYGEKEQALRLVGDTIALAKPGGLIRIFVDEGPPMASLLYTALDRGISPDYVSKLLASISSTKIGQTDSARFNAVGQDLIEPLSDRELEVLQLIAEGLTNPEIASRLYLSTHTVKVHARNIYSKLAVRNRTQAVTKGKSLGILPPD